MDQVACPAPPPSTSVPRPFAALWAQARRALRGGCAAFALATLLGLPMAAIAPAAAQGWFGEMFGGAPPANMPRQRAYPAYPGYGYGGGGQPAVGSANRPHRRRPVVVQKEATPAPVKADASIFVDVFGDSLGQWLANGLDDALSDRADVGIVHKARGSSGLVTKDYYDWPKVIDDLLASKDPKDKIDVAVMMIGSNDRQPISEDGKTLPFESDEWTAAYKKRVMDIDEAFRKEGIPLVWVGVPITRDSGFANDMAAFNDIYREAAAKSGAFYVDTWEPFSDDNGEFDPYGPDINGQTVKLRSADGIYFTKAGARKLAHFVEALVRRALDGKTPPVELPTAEAPTTAKPAAAAPTVAVVKPEFGPIKNLNEPPTAANGELAKVNDAKTLDAKAGSADPVVETTLVKGEPAPALKGRADDFRWSDTAPR